MQTEVKGVFKQIGETSMKNENEEINIIDGRLERCRMRVRTSEAQVTALMNIIRSIKPEWYDESAAELPYAYQKESCIVAVDDIYTKANRAWENNGDWNAAVNEAAKDERIPQRKPLVIEGAPVLTEEEFKKISEKMDT